MSYFKHTIPGALLLFFISANAFGFQWSHFWKTADQEAYSLLKKGQFARARERFQNNAWKATATYQAQNYSAAAEEFKALGTETGYYNQGNALAKMGQYEKALQAYDKVLKMNPKHADAIFNRKLVASLIKKNPQNSKDKQGNKQDKNQDNQQNKNAKDPQKNEQAQENKQDRENSNTKENQKEQANKEDKAKQDKNKEENVKQNEDKKDKQQEPRANKDAEKEAPMLAAEREKKQEKEQWLRLIPDDPGGLLREKFLRDSIRRQRGEY